MPPVHDYVISNASGASVRADLNNALAAIVSNNSNATSPSTTYAYQFWADTTTGQLKIRNAANSAWITLMELDGTMLMEDGTVSAPGLAFASDTNTGFFRSAADTLNFATGGVERLRIDSSGNVGIGTTSPSFASGGGLEVSQSSGRSNVNATSGSATLQLSHDGSIAQILNRHNSDLQFGTNNTERVRIDSSGRLLIGATTSSTAIDAPFQVVKDGVTAQFHRGVDSANGPNILLTKSRNSTYDSNTIVQNGDTLGIISFRGDDGTDYATRGVQIDALVDGTPGSNVMPGALVFKTTPSSSSTPSERMRINSAGQMLMGTTTAASTLSLAEFHKASGQNQVRIISDALSDNEYAMYRARATAGGSSRTAWLGLFKHSSISKPCGFMLLEAVAGHNQYYWTDDSKQFRYSTSVTNIGTTGGAVVGTQTSDLRLKNVGAAVSYGLAEVKQLQPKQYALKDNPDVNKLGFIAQEVESIIPEAVFDTLEELEGHQEGDRTQLGMEYVQLIPVLVNAIKELSAEVDTLKTKVAALEAG